MTNTGIHYDDLETRGSEFNTPRNQRYFLSHSIGLMPKNTPNRIRQHFLDTWQSGSDNIWPEWLNEIENFKLALADLFNTNSDQFCPQANVSSGLAKVIQSLEKKEKRRVILASAQDFPSAGFVLQQAKKLGFQVRLIASDQDIQSTSVWEQALTDDVHCVFITHVHYNTNKLIPVNKITEMCREKNITSIVDIAQSAGIVPINMQTLQADIVLGSCIKWLCGGPGAGFLWVRQPLIDQLEPTDVGWFSHKDPFEFDINNFEYAANASRFWGGTPSVAPYVAASTSIKLISNIGVDALRQYNQHLSQKILNNLPEHYVVSPLDLDKKGGTLVLKFDNGNEIDHRLKERGILFDSREYGIRLSPHIYNDNEDIDALTEVIRECINAN